MRTLLVVAIVTIAACAPQPVAPSPDAIRGTASAATPAEFKPRTEKSIVLVSIPGCKPCASQKRLIKDMISRGDLKGVRIMEVTGSTSEYPASLFPTLYICSGKSCKVAVGYQSDKKILELLK